MRVWCMLWAVLLITGCGSTIKEGNVAKSGGGGTDASLPKSGGGENDVVKAWKAHLAKVGRLEKGNCIDQYTDDDDTEYCIILEIDGATPTASGGMISPTTFTGLYYEFLPGEHRITIRNRLEEPREIIEMSFVAQAGHWYFVMAKSR